MEAGQQPENTEAPSRAIGPLGTVSRLGLGTIFLVVALSQGISAADAAIGLIAFPVATLAWVSVRAGSPPLRLYGTGGHCWTIAVAIAAFIVVPVATLLFFGGNQLLAASRGYAGCELFAVSNWLLGRDDQIACMVHTPIDAIEARMTRRP